MSNETRVASDAVRADIEARLDAVDRLLLGFIPRHERQSILRSLEDRLRSILANSPPTTASAAAIVDWRDPLAVLSAATAEEELTRDWRKPKVHPASQPKRSKLAVSSALLGLGAMLLLLGAPVAFFVVTTSIAEILDETIALALGGTYAALLLACSGCAFVTGLVALWRLRQPRLFGRGWAIAGLCTGSVPFALTGLLVLVVGLQMLGAVQVSSTMVSSAAVPTSEAADDSSDSTPIQEEAADGPIVYRDTVSGSPVPLHREAATGEAMVPAAGPKYSPLPQVQAGPGVAPISPPPASAGTSPVPFPKPTPDNVPVVNPAVSPVPASAAPAAAVPTAPPGLEQPTSRSPEIPDAPGDSDDSGA